VARFVGATVRHPLWLTGIAADVVGVTLQVLALHNGALVVVQPLLISGLLFSILLRRHIHITGPELLWSTVLTACLVAFLLLNRAGTVGTAGGGPSDVDRLPAAIAAVLAVVVVSLCLVVARRNGQAPTSAAVIGVALGVIYAGTAALLKAVSDIAVTRPVQVLWSWQLYALLAAGALGLLFSQLAFQAGPLTASLPATATVDPLVSIGIGVAIYDESIHRGPAAGLGLLTVLAVLVVAIYKLIMLDPDVTSAQDAGVAEGVAAGNGPDAQSVRSGPDGDPGQH